MLLSAVGMGMGIVAGRRFDVGDGAVRARNDPSVESSRFRTGVREAARVLQTQL